MLDKIIEKAWDSADKALQVGRRVDKHDEELSEIRADVKALQEALNEMGDAIRYLNDRLVREQERNADRHENMVLRLENALLRAGIGTPPLLSARWEYLQSVLRATSSRNRVLVGTLMQTRQDSNGSPA